MNLDSDIFDPTVFVTRLREHEETVPLETIQDQLRHKLALLKQQLYELINQDYPEFMSLANRLQGIEEHTSSLRSPLLDIAKSTEALMLGAGACRESMEAAVVKRAAIERRKRALERAIKFSETLQEAEVLIGTNQESDELAPFLSPQKRNLSTTKEEEEEKDVEDASDIDETDDEEEEDEEECVRLERAAHCSLRLLADLKSSEIAEIPKLHLMADRAKQLQHELLTKLTNVFVSQVTPPDKFSYSRNRHSVSAQKLVPCLRALAALQRGPELERAYGDLVLRPFIHATFTKGRLDNGERGSCKGLSGLYDATIHYVQAACGETLTLNEQIFGNQETLSIDLLCNGVWATISTALISKFGDDLFVTGLPDLFHANYSSTALFLRQLEQCANVQKSSTNKNHQLTVRKRLEEHASTLELWKKWNLPVYFQLRAEQVKKSVDEALANANKAASLSKQEEGGKHGVRDSSISTSLVSAFKCGALALLSPSMLAKRPLFQQGESVVPCMVGVDGDSTICHRHFNFLVMEQMLDCLCFCWRNQNVFLRPLAPKFLKLTLMVLAKFRHWLSSLITDKIHLQPFSNSNDDSKTDTNIWKLSTEELVVLSSDIRRFSYWINHTLAPVAESLMDNGDFPQKTGVIAECLTKASNDILELSSSCWKEVSVQIAGLCCEKLEVVKTVASTFRMTNKPAPSTCSPFLHSILAPLTDFNDVFGGQASDPEEQKGKVDEDWRSVAVDSISSRYRSIVLEVLKTVRSMEDALRKRKKNVKSGDGLSDAEKIGLQLYLDAREFSAELLKLNLHVESFPSLVELMAEVEPFSKFLAC